MLEICKLACALMLMVCALLGPALNARAEISSLPVTDAVIDNVWVVTLVAIVIKKSMYPVPMIVFDADELAVTPDTKPLNAAVTVRALAFVDGLFDNGTRTTTCIPATYVPFPAWYAGAPVIVNAACALMVTLNPALGPALNARPVISSVPNTLATIDIVWLVTPVPIVIKKSRYPVPRIVFDADAFAVTPDTKPLSVAFTNFAFAFVAGLFVNGTRTTNVMPATYVPLPVWYVGVLIASAACALMVTLNAALGPTLNPRAVISSLPVADAIIDNDSLAVTAGIVIRKSMYPFPRIVLEFDALAVTPPAKPLNDAVTPNARAFVAGLFVNGTRTTNVMPATYVLLPVWYVGVLIANAACALMVTLNAVLGPTLNPRAVISSLPVADAVIDNDSLAVTAGILIKKSMYPFPRIVFDADEFAVIPPAKPLNDAVTLNALAFVAGLFINGTRNTNVMPATYVPLPVWHVGVLIANAACALMVTLNAALGPTLNPRAVISSLPVADAVIDNDSLAVTAGIVIRKSMYPFPRIVFDADEFAVIPPAKPLNDAMTLNALAFVAGLFVSGTRNTNVMPATYVPLPVWYVGVLIANAACALMVTLNAALGPTLNPRAVISSLPVADAVIDNDSLAVTAGIVIRKSMYPFPRIVFDADEFAVTPPAKPLNDAVTLNALAFVAGLFVNGTRTTNVMPATYVPLPVWHVGVLIASAACALIAIPRVLVNGPSNRPEISSAPDTVVLIVTVKLVGATAVIVIKKSMVAVPLTVFDADEFAEMPAAPPNDNGAVTVSAFADAAGLLNDTRTTNCCPAT